MKLVGMYRSVIKVTLALSLAVGTAHAFAQPAGKDSGALKGPKVTDSGVPGESRMFGGGGDEKFDRERIIPHRLFMRSFEVLRGEEAGSLQLTPEQDQQLKSIDEAFRSQMDEYRAAHRDEAKALIADLSPQDRRRALELLAPGGPDGPRGERGFGRVKEGGKPGKHAPGRPEGRGPAGPDGADHAMPPEGRPGEGGPMDGGPLGDEGKPVDPQKAEAAREKLKALFEAAPKPDETHTKMFAVLTADQKAAVEKELEKAKAEMQARREEMYKERVQKDIKGKIEEGKKAGMDPEKIREFVRSLPASEREKLKDMDPKERREYVRKLWEESQKK